MENQQQIKKKMRYEEEKIIAKIRQDNGIDICVMHKIMRKMNRKKVIAPRKG